MRNYLFILLIAVLFFSAIPVQAGEKEELECREKLVLTQQRLIETQSKLLQGQHTNKGVELNSIRSRLAILSEAAKKKADEKTEKESGND